MIVYFLPSCKSIKRVEEGNLSDESLSGFLSVEATLYPGMGSAEELEEEPGDIQVFPAGYSRSTDEPAWPFPESAPSYRFENDEMVLGLKEELADLVEKTEYLKNLLQEREEQAQAELTLQMERTREKELDGREKDKAILCILIDWPVLHFYKLYLLKKLYNLNR